MPNIKQAYSGASIYLAAGRPATLDKTGFETLSYTEIGEFIEIDGDAGKTHDEVVTEPMSSAEEEVYKGVARFGGLIVTVDRVDDNTGQLTVETANDVDEPYTLKIQYDPGNVVPSDYIVGKVFGKRSGTGSIENMVRMEFDFRCLSKWYYINA